ncbi:MAG: hypothetical protein KTR14_08365 [Vampirovibrio sp.]|nr:hypothetical protein [Vampirovibrio sp.]
MPERLAQLWNNPQTRLALIAGVVVVVLVLGFLVTTMFSSGGSGGGTVGGQKIGELKLQDEKQLEIAKADNVGKALEIQALLAREAIVVDLFERDNKYKILLRKDLATQNMRDRAIIAIVQSGLMDKNIGLESFDKGDLTASREDKRIRLIRAQQGEISRLIRKIDPIQDAAVTLSIPPPSIFRSEQKPMSAAIQVTLPTGERLSRDKVRSIINLAVGSIQELDASHVSLTDTNGNTYNSVLDMGGELREKLEEQDLYMKQKVMSQLDKLVGRGNYVVTVSTLLREAPKEMLTQVYDPNRSAVSTQQSFTEKLNASQKEGSVTTGGPVSSFVPENAKVSTGDVSGGNSQRGYTRDGVEVSYMNAKTQVLETQLPGMIEDIAVAVTIDKSQLATETDIKDLKRLIARSASPKVHTDSVSIMLTDFSRPGLAGAGSGADGAGGADAPLRVRSGGYDWVIWAAGSSLAVILLLLFMMGGGKAKSADPRQAQQTQEELQELRDMAAQQQAQIENAQKQAQQLMETQQKQQQLIASTPAEPKKVSTSATETQRLKEALSDIQAVSQETPLEEEELDERIQSWIEST